ncbi:hypothetical protein ACYCAX_17770, partial [Pseudomonas sp. MT3]
ISRAWKVSRKAGAIQMLNHSHREIGEIAPSPVQQHMQFDLTPRQQKVCDIYNMLPHAKHCRLD